MESLTLTIIAVWMTSLWTLSGCYKTFQERIPNGAHVEHPCKRKYLWDGVGHKQWEGGGANNIFGTHFEMNGYKWDSCLCIMDSDGDGRTNGEELGDPSCTWKPGQPPERISNISHPGICEPLDDPKCKTKNDFQVCTELKFECEAAKRDDVKTLELKLPPTDVTQRYIHMCMTFDLPAEDNHVIAWEPIIDNPYVVHHIKVFGCPNKDYTAPRPIRCEVTGLVACSNLLFAWLLGSVGDCLADNYGFFIGKNGMTRFQIQFGWENPLGLKGQSDASGVRIYYTPKLRPYNLETVTLGQLRLNIPPGREEYIERGWCGSNCTRTLKNPIYIVQAFFVMHYHGTWGKVSILRNGQEVATPISHAEYRYHQPLMFRFDKPIMMHPGDEITTTCAYNSLRRTTSMYWSGASNEELCLAFLTYYPDRSGLSRWCISEGFKHKGCPAYPPESTAPCNVDDYIQSNFTSDLASLRSSCVRYMCKFSCRSVVDRIKQLYCFDDEIRASVLYKLATGNGAEGREFSDYLRSCEGAMYVPLDDGEDGDEDEKKIVLCTADTGSFKSLKQAKFIALVGVFIALIKI